MNQSLPSGRTTVFVSLFATLLFAFGSLSVNAQPVSTATPAVPEESIEALSASLSVISEAVANSDDISASEKIVLYTQLVELSRLIMTLQSEAVSTMSVGISVEEVVGQMQLSESDVHRVVVQLDWDSFTGDIIIYNKNEEDEVTIAATSNRSFVKPETGSFTQMISGVKQEVAADLAQELNILTDQLFGATFVSTRNPLRDATIVPNSVQANTLFEQFGSYSIITEVEVNAGENDATVVLRDDQEQSVLVGISRNVKENERDVSARAVPNADATYSARFEFYLSEFRASTEREESRSVPVASSILIDLTQDELIDFLKSTLAEMPFTDSIPDADQKLVSFMLNNESNFVQNEDEPTPRSYPESVARQCISASDVIIMNEFMLQVILGFRAQYITTDDLYSYRVPIIQEGGGPFGCVGVRDYF